MAKWKFDRDRLRSHLLHVKGWREAELARRMGITRQSLWGMFTGKHTPSIDTILMLMNATGLEPGDIFVYAEDESEDTKSDSIRLQQNQELQKVQT